MNWQRQLFENIAAAFERETNSANAKRQGDAIAAKVEKLETKLQQKVEAIAEFLQVHVQLKELGELNRSWAPHENRDEIADFVPRRTAAT